MAVIIKSLSGEHLIDCTDQLGGPAVRMGEPYRKDHTLCLIGHALCHLLHL